MSEWKVRDSMCNFMTGGVSNTDIQLMYVNIRSWDVEVGQAWFFWAWVGLGLEKFTK
jgi:hypothetical protein